MSSEAQKVLIVSESSLEQFNGVSGSVKRVAEHLSARAYDAQLLTPKPAPRGRSYAGYVVRAVPKVKLQGFPVGVPTHARVYSEVERFGPDVIHLASPVSKLGNSALRAAERLGIPTVAIYQTDVAQYAKRFAADLVDKSGRKGLRWLRDGAGVALETLLADRIAWLHNRSDLTLAPSRPAVQRLIDFGVEPSRIKIWRRGVDTELFTPGRVSLPEVNSQYDAWSDKGRRAVIGYVGRLAPEKSVEKLEVLKKLGVQLVVVGDGPSRLELERKLGDGAIFTGKLSGEALANAYASFDVFVHTGAEETFGQTLQEAMATGLPVIAPAAGGPLDIVDNGVTGFLYSPGLEDQLISSVESLIDNDNLRMRMGRAGLDKVSGQTWSRLGDELLGHYQTVVYEKKRGLA